MTSKPSTADREPAAAAARLSDGVRGTLLAVASAFSYALTIIVGRNLAKAGLPSATALGARFAISAVILFGLIALLRRPLLPAPGERWAVIGLGAVGYAVEATFFYLALERGSAAAVALLFYAYPAIVTVIEAAFGLSRHSAAVYAALTLSAAGTALVVVSGSEVSITTAGVVFALCSATTFAMYLLAGHRFVKDTDSMTTGAWVAGGASLSLVARGAVTDELVSVGGHAGELLLTGAATASAFTLMFAALRRLDAAPAAVVMTLEAVFAIILASVLLDEGLAPLQLVGGAMVLAATAIIGLSNAGSRRPPEPCDDLPP